MATQAEIEAAGVAKEVAANKRRKDAGLPLNAVEYEAAANIRSRAAGFKNAVDQEIDANRRAREAGFKNAALKENPAAAAPGESIYSTDPFVDPRTDASTTYASGEGDSSITVSSPNIQTPDMATLTSEMDLTNKLGEIINKDSPLFKAATTKALQNMQRRGIVNSTLAHESVMNAVLSVAMPIAKTEIENLMTNLYYNKDWTNKQKMQANEYAYNKMLTQLQGQINFALQGLVGSQNIGLQTLKGTQMTDMEKLTQQGRIALQTLSGEQRTALQELLGQQGIDIQTLIGSQEMTLQQQKIAADLWSKYGDWVTTMATTEGADQDAWKRMLDLLKGAGGWPKPT
jgi:hypothetical protein